MEMKRMALFILTVMFILIGVTQAWAVWIGPFTYTVSGTNVTGQLNLGDTGGLVPSYPIMVNQFDPQTGGWITVQTHYTNDGTFSTELPAGPQYQLYYPGDSSTPTYIPPVSSPTFYTQPNVAANPVIVDPSVTVVTTSTPEPQSSTGGVIAAGLVGILVGVGGTAAVRQNKKSA
jgi:hypothetical protein